MEIKTENGQVYITSEYNEDFIAGARKLSGKWNSPSWVFPGVLEDDVRALCLSCYGDDGLGVVETVTLRLSFNGDTSALCKGIILAGREIARAWGRDSGAKWGSGVVCRAGDCASGGSVKNWQTCIEDGTVVELLNYPKTLVENMLEQSKGGWDNGRRRGGTSFEVEIIESENIDLEKLRAEKERLETRLAEINNLLASDDA